MKLTLAIVGLLALVAAPSQAQNFTTASTIGWNIVDGNTVAEAQAYEARVRVDGATVPIVVPGVTCVPVSVTDAAGGVWTLGAGVARFPVLRNGTAVAGVFGVQFATYVGSLFVQGDDTKWYKFVGTTFTGLVATDPTPAVLVGASQGRWACSAKLTAALVALYAVKGTHSTVLRIYDPATMKESEDSVPFVLAPRPLGAPTGLKITP